MDRRAGGVGGELRGVHGLDRGRADAEDPAMFARRRYLNVYCPTGSRSKKKFVPLSRVSSYQAIPRSHL